METIYSWENSLVGIQLYYISIHPSPNSIKNLPADNALRPPPFNCLISFRKTYCKKYHKQFQIEEKYFDLTLPYVKDMS